MKRSGLTLIEVTVALALGVLLVAGVQVLTVRSYQTAKSLRTEITNTQSQEGWLCLLRTDLLNQTATGNLSLQNDELVITTLNDLEPTSLCTRSTVAVRYRREADGFLSRTQRDVAVESWPDGVCVLPKVKKIDFEVFDGQFWHGQWPLPHMSRRAIGLRILIETEEGAASEVILPLSAMHWSRHD